MLEVGTRCDAPAMSPVGRQLGRLKFLFAAYRAKSVSWLLLLAKARNTAKTYY